MRIRDPSIFNGKRIKITCKDGEVIFGDYERSEDFSEYFEDFITKKSSKGTINWIDPETHVHYGILSRDIASIEIVGNS